VIKIVKQSHGENTLSFGSLLMVLSGLRTRKMRSDLTVFKSLPSDVPSLTKSRCISRQTFVQKKPRTANYSIILVNSAFHPSGVDKSSTGRSGWG